MSTLKTPKSINITELKNKRETYGGDSRSINRHSVRVYESRRPVDNEPIEFYLNRTLDGCPPFYCLYLYKPVSSRPTMLKIESEEYWGSGLSWEKAEARAMNRIRELFKT
jgi:hypothetical protein